MKYFDRLESKTISSFFQQINFQTTFAAFSYKNYQLWFAGQIISITGTWMQTTAQGYLIYEMTKSPAYLGYVGLTTGIPSWFFMLYAGTVADRMSKRKLLVMTQVAMMILAGILAFLTFTGLIEPWHILILSFLSGTANAFDAPTRQAFVLEMVDRPHLGNAIALNSSMFNFATIIGPAISGVTYALVGPAWCFLINALSFITVIVALMKMKLPAPVAQEFKTSVFEDLKEGILFGLRHEKIRTLIAITGMAGLFGLTFITLMPAWAVDVLHGNASTNGWLQSGRGLGAFLGAMMMASIGHQVKKGQLLTFGHFIYPTLVILFAYTRSLPSAFITLVGIGWGTMMLFNMANTLVQSLVPDHLRGRIMGLYTLTFFGSTPLGALWAGFMAEWIGAPATLIISAIITLIFALYVKIFVPGIRSLQ